MSGALLTPEIESKMREYYENYYRKDLGLPDWQTRVEARLDEEAKLAEPHIAKIEEWMGLEWKGKRVLVVGAGTGAETVVFHRRGAEVHAIEPYAPGYKITQLKAAQVGLPADRIKSSVAEALPFNDSFFDFVYCYTVIEHVQDVEKTVREMIRVCKVDGLVYIQTPDYRFPYEGHYKSSRPGFSSKWFTRALFALQRKPVKFLGSVNFVNGPELDRIFQRNNVLTLRIQPPWVHDWEQNPSKNQNFVDFADRTGIGKDQFIFLRKLGNNKVTA
jgi:2-polyprenyl-3-methyl-5-hydroxy-6-metoxy-1,4-benzoquinol methylase